VYWVGVAEKDADGLVIHMIKTRKQPVVREALVLVATADSQERPRTTPMQVNQAAGTNPQTLTNPATNSTTQIKK
jgi:hypothetical protein